MYSVAVEAINNNAQRNRQLQAFGKDVERSKSNR